MNVFKSQVRTSTEAFSQNQRHHYAVLQTLCQREALVEGGGGEELQKLQKSRDKLLVRERIELLLDRDSLFLELSKLAAFDMYNNRAPSAGIVTGIGRVSGRDVMIIANDSTVKAGSYFPMTIKKHLRAQEIAEQNRLPCLYLVDSGGAYLPLQAEVFPDKENFGRIFYNQAQMSAKGIPQLAVVFGHCTAGGAYIPAMSDESVIVKGHGSIFLGGPPLVKAATGQDVTAEELGGADVHCRTSGVADHMAMDEKEALSMTRSIVARLNCKSKLSIERASIEEPIYDGQEILGIVSHDLRKPFDMREVIVRIVDGSRYEEFKPLYGTTISCGFARLAGYPVGIIGNNGVLFSESSLKAAHFIELCCQRKTPLIFLQNIPGFMVGKRYEAGGIAKDGAKMVMAVSNAQVPKFTVIVGGSFGGGNYGMCGRAFNPRFLWMWPGGRIGVMSGSFAGEVLATVRKEKKKREGMILHKTELDTIKKPIEEKIDYESSPFYSTARLWDDGILNPLNTRKILSRALEASLNTPIPETRFGVFRM